MTDAGVVTLRLMAMFGRSEFRVVLVAVAGLVLTWSALIAALILAG